MWAGLPAAQHHVAQVHAQLVILHTVRELLLLQALEAEGEQRARPIFLRVFAVHAWLVCDPIASQVLELSTICPRSIAVSTYRQRELQDASADASDVDVDLFWRLELVLHVLLFVFVPLLLVASIRIVARSVLPVPHLRGRQRRPLEGIQSILLEQDEVRHGGAASEGQLAGNLVLEGRKASRRHEGQKPTICGEARAIVQKSRVGDLCLLAARYFQQDDGRATLAVLANVRHPLSVGRPTRIE
mmetsp:Transcript_3863/g.9688  ORF Transcript_3863/g.9688 Transcript_3863/m.9688 type:complete len:244 (+) Transcript_3863:643-1374(+)